MDEFLISTDVDKIIRILRAAGAGGIEFRELLAATGIRAESLRKWLDVLEGQGSARVENRLTKQICYWAGDVETGAEAREARSLQSDSSTSFEKIAQPPDKGGAEKEDSEEKELQRRILELEQTLKEQQGVDAEKEFEAEPEQVEGEIKGEIAPEEEEEVEEILNAKAEEEKKEAQAEESRKEAERAAEYEREGEKEMGAIAPEIEKEEGTLPAAEIESERHAQTALASIRPKKVMGKARAMMKMPKAKPIDVSDYVVDTEEKPKVPENRLKSQLSTHLQAISTQMDKIEKLKLEKEKLLREIYSPLEQRLETEIDVISNRIMERERLILKLREAVAALPEKAAALESGYSKMRKLGTQAREQYDQTDTLLEESLSGISEAKEKLDVEAEGVRQQVTSQQVRIEELEKGMRSVAEQKDALVAAVDSAHALIVQESARLRKAQGAIDRLAELQTGIEGEVKDLQHNMAGQNRILEDMENQLTTLSEIERWVDENRRDYSAMISQVEDYVGEADREYLSLREEVEANFVRRYLRELRGSTDSYQFEIEQAEEREMGIDERMAQAKERLSSMIAEGKKISYLYEMQAREESKSHMEQMKEHEAQMLAVKVKSEGRTQVQEMIGDIIAKNDAAVAKIDREEGAVLAPRKTRPKARVKIKMKVKIAKKKGKAAKAKMSKAKKKGKKR